MAPWLGAHGMADLACHGRVRQEAQPNGPEAALQIRGPDLSRLIATALVTQGVTSYAVRCRSQVPHTMMRRCSP